MKPEHEDPNNHVPKISDDDDWDDLDSDSPTSAPQLPPRRSWHGLPPKKEVKQVHVRLHEPKLKPGSGDSPPPFGKGGSAEGAGEKDTSVTPENADGGEVPSKKRAAKKTAKKTAKKSVRKVGKKAARKSPAKKKASEEESVPEPVGTESADPEETGSGERTVLPVASGGRIGKIRVNRIGSSGNLPEDTQRLPKMEPATGAVGKKTENGEESGRQRRRFVRGERSDWGENRGRGSLLWMLGSGVGIVGIVVLAVFLSQRGGRGKAVGADSAVPMDELSEKVSKAEAVRIEKLERLANSQEEAFELYRRFENAESPEELSGILFNAEENLPLVTEKWVPPESEGDSLSDKASAWRVVEEGGVSYGVLEGTGIGFKEFSAAFREEDGSLKLDWRASTGFGTATFEELGKGIGDGDEIRGRLSAADFYTYPFPEEEYRSFRLLPPGDGRTVWVYTERGSEIDGRLRKVFTPSQITGEARSEVRITLSLEPGPEESLPNQWLINDIKGFDWLEK